MIFAALILAVVFSLFASLVETSAPRAMKFSPADGRRERGGRDARLKRRA
jgi:hypothetical protein